MLTQLGVGWIDRFAQDQQLVDDASYQVARALQNLGPQQMQVPDSSFAFVASALSGDVHLVSLTVSSTQGAVLLSEHVGDPRKDNDAPSLASYFSPLPATKSIDAITMWPTNDSKLIGAHASAVISFVAPKNADGASMIVHLELLLVGSLICVAVIWIAVHRSVHQPTQAIIRVAERIAEGDWDLRLAITTDDEFGKIMRAFNNMTDSLLTTQQQADTDGLTQLYNHRYLQEKIGENLARARRTESHLAVILIDLNKFKLLNDTYGHLVGDRFLQQTAGVLRRAIHLDGIVGRYGGDEFVILLPYASRERANVAAARVRDLMRKEQFRPHPISEPIPISFSMGVAVFPEDGQNAHDLIEFADSSLYSEKDGAPHLAEMTRDIEQAFAKAAHKNEPHVIDGGLFRTLLSLVTAIDHKDQYTKRHSEHVADLAVQLGKAVGLTGDAIETLQIAAMLHDVGKIGVADAILRKPGFLGEDEYKVMKGHVELGERLIQGVPHEDEVRAAVATHHEHWDGSGYPHQLREEEIPLNGRILAIADAYSAMSLDRPYRRAKSHEEACAAMRKGAGVAFDPQLVAVFMHIVDPQTPSLEVVESPQPMTGPALKTAPSTGIAKHGT
jgi:diguanylate cyclase (GGDEF)-like protein